MPGVKIDELVYSRIRALSEAEDRPMATVIRRALDVYEREVAFNRSVRAKVQANEARSERLDLILGSEEFPAETEAMTITRDNGPSPDADPDAVIG